MNYKPRKLGGEVYSIKAIDRAIQVLNCFSLAADRRKERIAGLTTDGAMKISIALGLDRIAHDGRL